MKASNLFLVLFLFLTGCVGIPDLTTRPSAAPATAVTLPGNLPDPLPVAKAYLDAWKSDDYPAMYDLLTTISKSAISLDEFTRHYQGVAKEVALSELDYEILSSLTNAELAQVGYRVKMVSSIVNNFQADTAMNLSLEKGQWHIQWDDTLVLPQLKGNNYLSMDRGGYFPARANIYDRNGNALVAQADATAIGLYPDQIDPAQSDELYQQLSELTDYSADTIKAMHAGFPPGAGWYLPLGQVPAAQISNRYETLSQLKGLLLEPYKARYYFDNGVAPHVIGYMGEIPADQMDAYLRKGYRPGDRVGLSGLESWAEDYLAGKPGGALYVRDAQGKPVALLAESPAKPGNALYITIDREFEEGVQQSIAGFRGAVVVLERDSGRVLAMVSSPDFDPNAFEPVNFNSDALLENLNNPNQPLFNRATQGQYPLGSVFKIITMAAALESGLYRPESTYYCDRVFKELQGVTLYDWTNDYNFPPSGNLNLIGGLIRSCNPWFYHIGLDLYNRGLESEVSEMARGFGLGRLTGIQGVIEAPGQVLDPESQIDATNQSIGQGALLVTPLQVANFIAALGNGGTLFRPQLVERILTPDGNPILEFAPEALSKLPIQQDTLQAIRQGMIGVVESSNPRGTAQHVFTGLDIPLAGKTGTAQTGISAPHAWFAGYTYAEDPEHPDIAAVVIAENSGEGSDVAAPIFRRIVELYFRGLPGKLYDWESTYNITRTPPAEGFETPVPAP